MQVEQSHWRAASERRAPAQQARSGSHAKKEGAAVPARPVNGVEAKPLLARTDRPGPDICVILNTRSGRKRREAIEELQSLFDAHPGRFELKVLKSGKEIDGAARAAVAHGYPTIVAAGGDGTISGVATCIAGSGSRLGVLAFGTFNYFARSLGLPEEHDAAVQVLLQGSERELTLGEVNGYGFLNNASIGAYAAILQRREQIYKKWGRSRIAAYWSVLITLLKIRTSQKMAVEVDGERHELRSPLVFVANNAYQLEEFGLPGADSIERGRLVVFIAPDRTGLALLAYGFKLAMRKIENHRDFLLLTGREIRVETKHARRLVAWDGEKSRMTGPFTFRVRPDVLRVAVPAKATAEGAQ
jgi:diacylglycerol kinase family enzyme